MPAAAILAEETLGFGFGHGLLAGVGEGHTSFGKPRGQLSLRGFG